MDDKELIEVWRAEFESQFDDDLFARGTSGAYINHHRNSMWQGFCMAKRSQPAITVPAYDMHHFAPVRNLMAKMDAAGIKYKIGN